MSLRWRLTILTAALIALASGLLGVTIAVVAERVQLSVIDRALAAALTDARFRVLDARPRPADAEVTVGIATLDRANGSLDVVRAAGSSLEPVPFPSLSADQLAAAVEPITVSGSPDQRVLVRDIRLGRVTVVGAAPLTGLYEARARLTRGIVLSVCTVTALGAMASWAMVRRYFRPMDEMVAAARAISTGHMDQRIPAAPDDTELGELAAALNAMIASLTSSVEATSASEDRLRRFVSDASHEIRTPLTVIRGYAELLHHDLDTADDTPGHPRDEVRARAVARILSESQRLERLVSQLLLLERLDAGVPLSHDRIDLEPLVRQHAADLGPPLSSRRLQLTTAPAIISGDADAWRQVLANLVQNVARHTPDGSDVAIDLTRSRDEVLLTVDDAGPGIPADRRDAVLGRFTRLDPTDDTGGLGLGMSIVERVVTEGGGRLTLSDSPLGGLRVQIALPAAAGALEVGNLPAGP